MGHWINETVNSHTIRCLLFDLGETLWIHKDKATDEAVAQSTNQRVSELLQSFFSSSDHDRRDYTTESIQLRSAIAQRSLHWRRYAYDIEPDPYLVTSEACQLLHFPALERDQLLSLFEAFRPPLVKTRHLFDDTLHTLQKLKARFLLGCVTDRQYGGFPFLSDLQALGLLEYFDSTAIVVSADCGKRKPHAAPFLHVLSALNVAPQETAMVGDFLCRDIAGAKRLGMTTVWKPKAALLQDVHLLKTLVPNQSRQKTLLTCAAQQEKESYPEMPFDELQQFMLPDAIIERPIDLLALFP